MELCEYRLAHYMLLKSFGRNFVDGTRNTCVTVINVNYVTSRDF